MAESLIQKLKRRLKRDKAYHTKVEAEVKRKARSGKVPIQWKRKRDRAAAAVKRARLLLNRAVREAVKQDTFHPRMLNGHPGNIGDAEKRFIVRAVRAGLVVTSTTDLRHSPGSKHYSGQAVDVAAWSWSKMNAFYRSEAEKRDRWDELFGPGSFYIRAGRKYAGQFPAHGDHVHGAPRY